MRWARQRVVRGWDERAYWSTDSWLAEHLGQILLYAAENAHGYPSDYPDGGVGWRADMHKHGQALINYNKYQYDWGNSTRSFYVEDGQRAMYWVANNFSHLWD